MSEHDRSEREPDQRGSGDSTGGGEGGGSAGRAGGGTTGDGGDGAGSSAAADGDTVANGGDAAADGGVAASDGSADGSDGPAGDGEAVAAGAAGSAGGEAAPDGGEPLDWETAAGAFERRREERRTVGVEVPDEGVAEFTLRGLTREERDEVEDAAASIRRTGRGEPEIDVDTGVIRRKMLEYGIVSGPEGFDPARADHLDALPPGVQDDLVDIVEEMSTLTVEERDGFPEMG